MSLNNTPSSERIHIGIFGRRNAGKSSIINALTGQQLAIVSEVKGTTTDPVLKAMELLPVGPVVMIDTPGLDDDGELGLLRIQKARQILNKTDIALLIIDGLKGMTAEDDAILARIQEKEIPFLIILNKADLTADPEKTAEELSKKRQINKDLFLCVSASSGKNIAELKNRIAALVPEEDASRRIVSDLLKPLDTVFLVVPIDKAAPKGRLILPQQQTIRDLLDAGIISVVVRDTELEYALNTYGKKPALVITDSQVFERAARIVPEEIPFTSFSILFARYKGNLNTLVRGANALDSLSDGDTVLLSEGCTHHRQCGDIGTVKLPRWIEQYTGKKLDFAFTSGTEFPSDLSRYRIVIHCGGCMLNEREMKYRIRCSEDAGVPITNYGTAIAHLKGILPRSIKILEN